MTQQLERIDLKLAPEPKAPLTARRALDRLVNLLPPAKLEDVRLVVSELVTNSVLHAELSPKDRIRVVVAVRDGAVRGEIQDPGSGFGVPSKPQPRPDFSGGACRSSTGSRIAGESSAAGLYPFGSRSTEKAGAALCASASIGNLEGANRSCAHLWGKLLE